MLEFLILHVRNYISRAVIALERLPRECKSLIINEIIGISCVDDEVGHNANFGMSLSKCLESVEISAREILRAFDLDGVKTAIDFQDEIDFGAAVDSPVMNMGGCGTRSE